MIVEYFFVFEYLWFKSMKIRGQNDQYTKSEQTFAKEGSLSTLFSTLQDDFLSHLRFTET